MSQEIFVERFFESLVNGDRPAARAVIDEAWDTNATPQSVISDIMWPTHEMIERLYKSDQLSMLGYHYSTRLLRVLIDQVAARLPQRTRNGKSALIFCGQSQGEELGAQMAVDLLESSGFTCKFAGGGVPSDEILAQVHDTRPNFLVMFASAASDLPEIRVVLNSLKAINASPNTHIAVGGGVFNRAEGLAEEIGIHLVARDPLEMVDLLVSDTVVAAATEQRVPVKKTKSRAA
jgi:MerR family transcriptional regulator, light-induced transcriptional regulator